MEQSTRLRQLTIIAVGVLIIGVLVMLGAVAGVAWERRVAQINANLTDDSELAAFRQKYGPARNSQSAEEWILKDFFGDRRGGVFVDVGANHHQEFSNTYYLETARGWSGIAIEPQTEFAEGYRLHRPRTRFVPLFVSDVTDQTATLYVADNPLVSSNSRQFTEWFGGIATARAVKTTTLDDVLARVGIARIDFLSMDIELAEPPALAGFSIQRFGPALVAIEALPPIRQQLLDYFARHDYTVIGRYLRVDRENFWFAPLGTVSDAATAVTDGPF